MTTEYQRLRDLLIQFPDFQKEFQDYSPNEQRLLELVSPLHGAADRAYFETNLPPQVTRCHMTADGKFVFLTPFEEGQFSYLPLLAIDLDFTLVWPMISIHLIHYGLQNGLCKAANLKCFGYRYDKPAARVGDHNYFHVQFTHGHRRETRNAKIDRWISTKDPSIPIDATNSIEMFLSAVVSLRNRVKTRRALFDEWSQAGLPMQQLTSPMAMFRWL